MVEERVAPVRSGWISTPARVGPHVTIESRDDDEYAVRVQSSARNKKAALDDAGDTVDRLLALLSLRGVALSRIRRAAGPSVIPIRRSSDAGLGPRLQLGLSITGRVGVKYTVVEADGRILSLTLEPRLQRALSLFHLGCCAHDRETGFVTHFSALEILSGENKRMVLKELLEPCQVDGLLGEVCELFERYGIARRAAARLRQHLQNTKLESDLDVHARYVVGRRAMAGTLAEVKKSLAEIGKLRGSIVHTGKARNPSTFTRCSPVLESAVRKSLLSEMEDAVTAEPSGAESRAASVRAPIRPS